jgi:hypothetical protein
MKTILIIVALLASPLASAKARSHDSKATARGSKSVNAAASQSCPLPDGTTFQSANVKDYFFGVSNWKQTLDNNQLLSTELKDGIVSSRISFGNLNGSTFSVKFWDKEDGKVKTASAPKSAITVKNCSLYFDITYQGKTYPCEVLRTGDKRIAARIGGFLHQTVYMAPANLVREQTQVPQEAEGPEVPPELNGLDTGTTAS